MRRLSTFFLGLGVAIGVVGVTALALGFRPSQLPAALLDISVYKLVFIAAGCVLAAGAMVRRAERKRAEALRATEARAELEAGHAWDASRAPDRAREGERERR